MVEVVALDKFYESDCGEYTINEGTVKEGLFDYCPNCGAKMKGGAE